MGHLENTQRIGFMQGRLSPLVNGQIQAFPWPYWKDEFALAQNHNWPMIEWTLDHDRLHENPLMTADGQQEIRRLCNTFECAVPSLTGDFFMQKPFFKYEGHSRVQLLDDLRRVIENCAALNIGLVMLPLVDNGHVEDRAQENSLFEGLDTLVDVLKREHMKISFESDYAPKQFIKFIEKYDQDLFGITYDIGNSAALGYDCVEELNTYGAYINNVHVKDRLLGGTTVPLGTGNADFPKAFQTLCALEYDGHYILQTARAKDDNHVGILNGYRDQVIAWLEKGCHES